MTYRGNINMRSLDKDEIIRVLNKAYADAWLAYHQYLTGVKVVQGARKDDVIAQLKAHAANELKHTDMLADRVSELGGTPLLCPKDWFIQTNCGYEEPMDFDVLSILDNTMKSEDGSIYVYSQMVDMLRGTDVVTYDLVYEILDDQVDQKDELELLYNEIKESMS